MQYVVPQSARASVALLLLRLIIGAAFIFHGMPKIAHPSSWMSAMMGSHAFAPPWLQVIVSIVEFGGGITLILGFLTRLAAFGILVDMAVAILRVHLPMGGHFVGGRMSFETPLLYLVAMIAFLVAGAGMYSIDALLVHRVRRVALG